MFEKKELNADRFIWLQGSAVLTLKLWNILSEHILYFY